MIRHARIFVWLCGGGEASHFSQAGIFQQKSNGTQNKLPITMSNLDIDLLETETIKITSNVKTPQRMTQVFSHTHSLNRK